MIMNSEIGTSGAEKPLARLTERLTPVFTSTSYTANPQPAIFTEDLLYGVSKLRPYCFNGYGAYYFVTEWHLPASITEIGSHAFYLLQSTTTEGTKFPVFFLKGITPPTIQPDSFDKKSGDNYGEYSDYIVYIPRGTLAAYQDKWGQYYDFDFKEYDPE